MGHSFLRCCFGPTAPKKRVPCKFHARLVGGRVQQAGLFAAQLPPLVTPIRVEQLTRSHGVRDRARFEKRTAPLRHAAPLQTRGNSPPRSGGCMCALVGVPWRRSVSAHLAWDDIVSFNMLSKVLKMLGILRRLGTPMRAHLQLPDTNSSGVLSAICAWYSNTTSYNIL